MLTSTRLPTRSASGTVTPSASHISAPRPPGPVPASPGPASTSIKSSPTSIEILVMTSEAASASPHAPSITIVIITESASRRTREPGSTRESLTESSPVTPEASLTSP